MHHRSESTVHSTNFARGLSTAAASDRSPLPALTVLAHPDARRVGDRALLGEALTGAQVLLDRRRPEFQAPGRSMGRPLDDRHLSRRPIVLGYSDAAWSVDSGDTSTRVRVDGRRVDRACRFADTALDDGVVLELSERIVLLLHRHTPTDEASHDRLGLIGASDAIRFLRSEIRRVADLDVGVLLRGETGVGKELVARALHEVGRRAEGPFVALNLGALAPSLAASELFGAARGAFTGADRSRDGCFARADGGTLFLDEVGEAPSAIQVALLRSLETGEIQPVGASTPRPVDVRTLAATDADLEQLIATGGFREPLLHRLAGYEIWLPPLRRRRDDIGRLVVHFLRQIGDELGDRRLDPTDGEPWIDPELVTRMARYAWPGNVRQLRNIVRQLAIGNRGRHCLRSTPAVDRLLGESDAPATGGSESVSTSTATSPSSAKAPPSRRLPSTIDDDEIVDALRTHRFEVKAAAEALGFSRAALYAWIEDSPRVRTAGQLDADTVRQAHADVGGDLDALVDRLEVSRFALRRRLRELGL